MDNLQLHVTKQQWRTLGLCLLLALSVTIVLAAVVPGIVYASPATGSVLASFVPATTGNGRGMAFDGTDLYYTLVDDAHIYKVSTAGASLGSILVAGSASDGGPLAWDGSALWTVDYSANSFTLYRVDPGTGAILSSCNIATQNPAHPAVTSAVNIGDFPDGLDWTGSTLWVSGEGANPGSSNWVVEVDTSCNILTAWLAPLTAGQGAFAGTNYGASGVAFDGVNLWHSNAHGYQYQTDLAGAMTGLSFTTAIQLEDLAYDDVTFAPLCALWSNEGAFEANDITAYEVPCGNLPPTADANGPYSVDEGGTVALDGSASSDPDGDPLTYEWDLDNDGTFETVGQSPTFSTAGRDGPDSQIVNLQVCDPQAACATDSATVDILNVAPTVDAGPDAIITSGDIFAVNASFTDPGLPDTHTATIDWGDGIVEPGSVAQGAGSGTVSGSHQYFVPATYIVQVCVTDDDGGVGCDDLTLEVRPLEVEIDIKPGSFPNSINPGSKGNIPVAILSSATFDATTLDPATLTFGHTGDEVSLLRCNESDVNGDGLTDLVCHFSTPLTGFVVGDIEGILRGQTTGGIYVEGRDSVRIVPPT